MILVSALALIISKSNRPSSTQIADVALVDDVKAEKSLEEIALVDDYGSTDDDDDGFEDVNFLTSEDEEVEVEKEAESARLLLKGTEVMFDTVEGA